MLRPLFWKSLIVLGLALGLLIPLAMIQGQIQARSDRQKEVVANIAETSAGSQQLVGPLVVVDWLQWVERDVRDDNGKVVRNGEFEAKRQVYPAREAHLDGTVAVEERYRGLYKAQLFHLTGSLKGTFVLPAGAIGPLWDATVKAVRVSFVMGISDLRGVQNRPVLTWGNTTRAFTPGARLRCLGQGIQADLGPAAEIRGGEIPFEIPLDLIGTQTFSVAPVAEETLVNLHSTWPDPSFGGHYLPVRRQVGPAGFEASWKVSNLARNLDLVLEHDHAGNLQQAFDVSFIDSVNIYLQAERAVKYGFLFVGLTFAAFFFFELIRRLRIHPMQYGLVGLALALFFLLVISLSEHVPFVWAYLLASLASIGLQGAYLVHVLRSRARGIGFALGLTVLHGVLYGLLISEDNALLMGSVLLFSALAAVMLATRKLDWYALGGGAEEDAL